MPGRIGIGELLKDRYRLERTLGRGGMAAVWLGHDEVLERPVAVKVLSDTIADDPDFVARFRREAHTAAGLSHPNLVDVYDFSEEGERPYLVMQFVPGENLAERLERGTGVDCEQLARELLAALAHIHAAGILHRDVKPANVIVEPGGTAKLIDFGIALPRDATALTSTGLVLGTERYAAPEVMEGRPATERSDLYSCGVVLRAVRRRVLAGPAGAGRVAGRAGIRRERPSSARHGAGSARTRRAGAEPPTRAFEPTFERAAPRRAEPAPVERRVVAGALGRGSRARPSSSPPWSRSPLPCLSGGRRCGARRAQRASRGRGREPRNGSRRSGGTARGTLKNPRRRPRHRAEGADPAQRQRPQRRRLRAAAGRRIRSRGAGPRRSCRGLPRGQRRARLRLRAVQSRQRSAPAAAGRRRRSRCSNAGSKSPTRPRPWKKSWRRPAPKPADPTPAAHLPY